jgi:CDP-2,3-bis-(O-geranylgeranyl)-sn-glycerol synthase
VEEGLLVFVPAAGALFAHAPVLRFDLLPILKRPLDGGATFRGQRLLGENKTWRGALVMCGGVVAASLLLARWPWYVTHLPPEVRAAGPVVHGLLLGLGVVLGELPNSFLKRQLGIAPGARARSAAGLLFVLFDQCDFVPVSCLLLLPVWVISPAEIAAVLALVVVVHLAANVIGYAIGARATAV